MLGQDPDDEVDPEMWGSLPEQSALARIMIYFAGPR